MKTKTIKLTGVPVEISRFPVDEAIKGAAQHAAKRHNRTLQSYAAFALEQQLIRDGYEVA